MQRFDLDIPGLPRRTCAVRVGEGVLDALVRQLATAPPGQPLYVVSDDRVAPLHAEPLVGRLRRRRLRVALLTFPAGEASKTRRTKQRLEDRLAELGAGRDCALVAVGGGVTGDLAGFVAATWQRGVPVVQVPTSLLAMVDAALGGKTAVNLPSGKNLVGAFHQPRGVWADIDVLSTLDDRHFVEGLAEVVKSAVIGDAALFRWLERHAAELRARDGSALEHVVARCLRIKGRVVRRDEREAGRRAVLNFGHTVAHAVEAATGYRLRHGRAVAIGMCVEAQLAVRVTGLPRGDLERLRALLRAFDLPVELPATLRAGEVVRATRHDKKTRRGRVRYALPIALGRMPSGAAVTVAVGERRLRAALESRPRN